MHSLLNQLAERREEKDRNARELEEIKTLTQSLLQYLLMWMNNEVLLR